MIGELSDDLGHFLSFEENSLGNSCVLDFLLSDEDGFVREVVVDMHWPDSVVLESAFDDMFLEIAVIAQDLPIILEPGRLNARDVVVLGSVACFHEGEAVDGLAHFVNQVLIDIFLEELLLLLLRAIFEVELLGFVIVLLVGIVEDVSG